jgi:nucleotide-binding universal stress UspA family protein
LLPAISPEQWLRRMLIPLDGTPGAESVLDAAIALGSLYRADYSLLRVIPPASLVGSLWHNSHEHRDAGGAASVREEVSDYLNAVAERLNGHAAAVEAKTTTGYGPIAKSIVAKASTADCIAMATSARGGLRSLVRPSVAWQVIQLASVPVLVVRHEADN